MKKKKSLQNAIIQLSLDLACVQPNLHFALVKQNILKRFTRV